MSNYIYPSMPLEDTETDQTVTLSLTDYNKLISAYYKAVFSCNQNAEEINRLNAMLREYEAHDAEKDTK